MVRIRHGWLVAALALGVSVGACKKDEKSADTPAGEPASSGARAAGGKAATGTSDLDLLPKDSELVLGLNFAQLQSSALWKQFVEPQVMKGDAQANLAKFKAACGFDPMTALTSVSMGLKGLGGDQPDGVIVAHGTEKGKVLGCVDKYKAEVEKEGGSVTVDGDVVSVTRDGTTIALTFAGNSTMVVGVGSYGNATSVKAAAAGNSNLKSSPAFVEMYGKINTKDSLWVFMNGSAQPMQQAAAMGVKPTAVFGSLNVTDGLSIDVRLRLESADQATQLATMAKGQLGMAQAMVDKIEVTSEGSDVKVAVAISAQKLQSLVSQFGGMMGGLGGM